MGNAGHNSGEYDIPRPLIRAMIQLVKPRIGERIYDAAFGSAGLLCEACDYLRHGAAWGCHGGFDGIESGKGASLITSQL